MFTQGVNKNTHCALAAALSKKARTIQCGWWVSWVLLSPSPHINLNYRPNAWQENPMICYFTFVRWSVVASPVAGPKKLWLTYLIDLLVKHIYSLNIWVWLGWPWMEHAQRTLRNFSRPDCSVRVAGRDGRIPTVEDFFLCLLGALCPDNCSTPRPRPRLLVTAIWPASGEANELMLMHCFTAGPN